MFSSSAPSPGRLGLAFTKVDIHLSIESPMERTITSRRERRRGRETERERKGEEERRREREKERRRGAHTRTHCTYRNIRTHLCSREDGGERERERTHSFSE